MSRREGKNFLRDNRDFAAWLKSKPELMEKVRSNPAELNRLHANWRKLEIQRAGLLKAKEGYQKIYGQVQELSTLLQRLGNLATNFQTLSEQLEQSGMLTESQQPQSQHQEIQQETEQSPISQSPNKKKNRNNK